MSENPSTKWYWNDWDNDRALALCSLAAQGLWMRMLSIAARSGGYVRVNGNPCSVDDIAALVGRTADEVSPLVEELSARGVFSRTRDGTIYNRRMVRDEKNSRTNRKNGKRGGNPKLIARHGKIDRKSQSVKAPDKGMDKGGDADPVGPLIPLSPIPNTDDPSGSSGADAPAVERDPVKELWDRGIAVLGASSRSLIGKARREYGDLAVAQAIAACEAECPSQPAEFFVGCLRRAPPKQRAGTYRQSPVTSLFEGAHRAAEAFIERHQADSIIDFPVDGALLDGGRSGRDAAGAARRLARGPG